MKGAANDDASGILGLRSAASGREPRMGIAISSASRPAYRPVFQIFTH
jgi:hypothetical protein